MKEHIWRNKTNIGFSRRKESKGKRVLCSKAREIGGAILWRTCKIVLFNKHLLSASCARHCSKNWWYIIEQIKYPQYHGAYILLSHVNLFGLEPKSKGKLCKGFKQPEVHGLISILKDYFDWIMENGHSRNLFIQSHMHLQMSPDSNYGH